jgi:DnaJ-class molecular chaperone
MSRVDSNGSFEMAIIICKKCKGFGQTCCNIGTHNFEPEYNECDKCNGSGRLVEHTQVTLKPFVPDPNKATHI